MLELNPLTSMNSGYDVINSMMTSTLCHDNTSDTCICITGPSDLKLISHMKCLFKNKTTIQRYYGLTSFVTSP